MATPSSPNRIAEAFRDGRAIDEAICRAVADALARHKREGQAIVVAENGGVRIIPPDEIPIQSPEPSERRESAR